MMRIFNKSFLKPLYAKKSLIINKSAFQVLINKGFARNVKAKSIYGALNTDNNESNSSNTPNNTNVNSTNARNENFIANEFKIPKINKVGESKRSDEYMSNNQSFGKYSEEIILPNNSRDQGSRNVGGDFNAKKSFKSRSEEGEGDNYARRERSFGDRSEFKPRRDFGSRDEEGFKPRSESRFGDKPKFDRDRDREGANRFNSRDRGDFGGNKDRDGPPRYNNRDRDGPPRPRGDFGGNRDRDGPPRSRDFGANRDRDRDFPPRSRDFGGDRDRRDGPPRYNNRERDAPPRSNNYSDRTPSDKPSYNNTDRSVSRKDRRAVQFGHNNTNSTNNTKPEEDEGFEKISLEKYDQEYESKKSENKIPQSKITLADLKNKKASTNDNTNINTEDLPKDILSINDSKKSDKTSTQDEDSEPSSDFKEAKYDYIYGAHAVEAALTFSYRKCLDLFIQMNFKENTPDHVAKIAELAKSKGVKIKYLTRDQLDKFSGQRPHNGLIIKSNSREYVMIKSFDSFRQNYLHKQEGNLVVVLDQLVDPQNFGSIIRSSFFLGSDAIIVNRKNRPPISSSVCKVSSGASECAELFAVKPLRGFLSQAMTEGWIVVSTNIEKEHDVQLKLNLKPEKDDENEQPITENVEAKNISLTELIVNKSSNVILVLGSEANGIAPHLKGCSNFNVYIPPLLNKELTGQPPFNIIDSLNVGVSAGIIINHIKAQLKSDNKTETETANETVNETVNETNFESQSQNQNLNENKMI